VNATPDRAADGAHLADEVIEALATVTGEHPIVDDRNSTRREEAGAAAGRQWSPGGPEDVTRS
jgi:hypothetical protein